MFNINRDEFGIISENSNINNFNNKEPQAGTTGLITAFHAIIQSRQKLHRLYENRMIAIFFHIAQLMNCNFTKSGSRLYSPKFEGRGWARRRAVNSQFSIHFFRYFFPRTASTQCTDTCFETLKKKRVKFCVS